MIDPRDGDWPLSPPAPRPPGGGAVARPPAAYVPSSQPAARRETEHRDPERPDPERRDHHMAQPLSPRRQSRSRTQSSSRRKLKQMRWLVWFLVVVIVAAAVTGIFGLRQLQRFRGEANELATRTRQLEGELTRTRDRLTELGTDLRVLLANRIPGIAQISFGRPTEVNDRYVRSLTLVRAGTGGEQWVEYNIVLENGRTTPVVPALRILLFDAAGLQTGIARPGVTDAVAPGALAALAPGETRTYSGRVQAVRRAEPVYFLVEAD